MIDFIITILSLLSAFVLAGFVNPFNIENVWLVLLFFTGAFIVLYIVFGLLYLGIAYLISLTINTKKEYEKHSKAYGVMFSLLLEFVLDFMRVRIKINGMEKIPENRKFLFVSNHISIYDTFVQVAAFRKFQMAFISKPENFKIPIGHRYMVRCRYMALDRDNVRSGAIITKKAADMIASDDCCVGVYPEGTRNRTEETLIEFKPGCFKIAVWAKSPIVVSVVHNTNMIKKNFPWKKTEVTMDILDVLEYEDIKDLSTREIGDIVREKMLKGLQ